MSAGEGGWGVNVVGTSAGNTVKRRALWIPSPWTVCMVVGDCSFIFRGGRILLMLARLSVCWAEFLRGEGWERG